MKIRKLSKNRLLSSFIAFTMVIGLMTVPVKKVKAEVATYIVISEVYGGGGNSGAEYKNDFIELYNSTDEDIDLTGWKVQYASATGDFNQETALEGVIKSNGYFLIHEAEGSNKDLLPLPEGDATGKIAMSGSKCKVRLLDNEGNVVDLVGIGSANESEGNPAQGMSNSTSVQRKDNDGTIEGNTNGWDTNNNVDDFYAEKVTPRNSSYSTEKSEVATYVVISEVYGGGGNSGAEYKNDFIELYNPTDEDIDLTGWKVQYASATADFGQGTDLEGIIKADGYFLIHEAEGSNKDLLSLPNADATGKIAMSGSKCKVRLIDNEENVVDFVGIGEANEAEGDKTAQGMSNSTSVQRKDNDGTTNGNTNGWDTNNNEEDFYAEKVTPRNSNYSLEIVEITGLGTEENITLEVNETKVLLVSYEPENTTEKGVKFEVVDNEIATVDDEGNITGLKVGETTIKITSTVNEDISVESNIKVNAESDKKGPEITKIYPSENENLGDLKNPEIKASINDESGVNFESLEIYLNGENVIATRNDNNISYKVEEDLEDGYHTIKIIVKDTLGNYSEKEWRFTVGEVTKNLYFGQLHSHTNLSDGTGTVDDAYKYAENEAGVDFLAVTDHSNWFDNDLKGNINDGSASNDWKTGHEAADKYNKDGDFIAIYGYEMTWSGSTGGYGHMNTYNTEGFETRSNSAMDLKTYYETLKTQPQSLSQFNHPGKTFGDFSDFAHYDEAIDKVVNLIEVGNGEGEIGSSGYFRSYEYYTRALDKGWHLAPSNNQDNHKGKWGNANTAKTVIEASDLTRDSIYDAVRNMRVYATEDENLRISYEVNGNTMGSILPETDNLSFVINVDDIDSDDIIEEISIIGDGGKVINSINDINDNSKEWKFSLNESNSSYYYVRVDQADDEIAVTAPVWVGEKENFGISTIEEDRDLILVDEEFNINTTIYNNEVNTINDIEVKYYLEDNNNKENLINTEKIDSITPGETFISKLPYTFNKAGSYSFIVKAYANINGNLKEFKSSIEIEVLNESEVSKVVIDGAHQNQYVTGDYAGKVTTLTELMSNNNIKPIINNEKITDEILEGASLLILSDPQSSDDSKYGLSPHKYSEDEIEAISKFVKNGGNLIITSKADYKDAEGEYQNSTQGNLVLNAIGAKIRFNDDQATDDDNNGGQSYRLYLNKYNNESSWLDGVDTSKNYSFYSGATLIMPDDMSDIEVLVKGHETTYGNSADNKNDNVVIEKGNVVALAVETLENGSKVFVSGATFFSNFEIDSNEYSNNEITKNIITQLSPAPEMSVSKIADVRVDKDNDNLPDRYGEKVVVEGYVTSASNTAAPGNTFFDVIYIQDETAGLTVFGVSDLNIKLGQKVRITGRVSSYLGDAQVALENEYTDVEIIDESINLVDPTELSTKNSMLEENEGLLVKIKGKVTRMEGQNIFVDDGSGEARIYTEGYVGNSEKPEEYDEWKSRIKVGDTISAIGLASEDPEGHRLRVRNSAEIKAEIEEDDDDDGTTTPGDGDDGTTTPGDEDGEITIPGDEDDGTTTPGDDEDIDNDDSGKDNQGETGKGSLPETGGNNPIFIVLLAIAIIGVGAFLVIKKRNIKIVNK